MKNIIWLFVLVFEVAIFMISAYLLMSTESLAFFIPMLVTTIMVGIIGITLTKKTKKGDN